jgi:glycosyltransferase involved in cell wall biosynthesis
METADPASVHWLTDTARPYTSVLLRALHAVPEVDLHVYYVTPTMSTHPWEADPEPGLQARTYRKRLGLDWSLLSLSTRDPAAYFVVGGWNEPTMQSILSLRRLRGLPYAIWTDTPDLHWLKRSRLKTALRSAWLGWIFAGAHRVMGTGQPALEALEAMGCAPEKLVNLPYFIDVGRYHPCQQVGRRSPLILGSAGQLAPRKDLGTALAALGRLYREGHRDWRYRLVGVGPEEAKLRALAREWAIDRQVEFTSWLNGPQLLDFYRDTDILLHPCEWEPYGVVVLEAMATGIAVICSDRTCAALDRVVHGENGLIHRTWDAEHLADQIRSLLAHPERIGELGAAARASAEAWPVSRGVEAVRAVLRDAATAR